jgi:hypothetical protein
MLGVFFVLGTEVFQQIFNGTAGVEKDLPKYELPFVENHDHLRRLDNLVRKTSGGNCRNARRLAMRSDDG